MPRIPFFSAPHRLMFAGGVVQALAVMLFWSAELAGRHFAQPLLQTSWPPTWIHAGLMVFGVFPWFIFGFLMTALPKWMGAPALLPRQYLPSFFLLAAGWLAFYLGIFFPALGPGGLLLVAAGWLGGTFPLLAAVRSSLNERSHAHAVLAGQWAGVASLLAFSWALARLDAAWYRAAVEFGLWACLAPTFFIVLHRMLPFFTSAVIRSYESYQPMWALWLMLAAMLGHGALAALEMNSLRWLPDAVAAGVAWHLSYRWGLKASLKMPMLAMIHLGALWLAAAMSLYALQGLLLAFGIAWGGLIPPHALGIGFFASILIGMATRVTLGHSGRPIAGDRWGWRLFLCLQGVVALRLAGEVAAAFSLLAALGWLVVFGLWAAVHLPMYFRPRLDGQPG